MKRIECEGIGDNDGFFELEVKASPVEPVVMLPMPDGLQRVETGVVQFGNDWPSIHIRGDNAMDMAMLMRTAAQSLRVSIGDEISAARLEGYADIVASCLAT